MLEECGLPYIMVPVNIGRGEQFEPEFLRISPNNRMPAIVDPNGPGAKPISIFESGAILQYLGRKTGKFYPADERARVAVDEWLFWQMAGLGPMTGQANHFLNYAKDGNDYARKRYVDEVHRLLGVMNKRLAAHEYLAGAYSIADMACWGWVIGASRMHDIGTEFPQCEDLAREDRQAPSRRTRLRPGARIARTAERRSQGAGRSAPGAVRAAGADVAAPSIRCRYGPFEARLTLAPQDDVCQKSEFVVLRWPPQAALEGGRHLAWLARINAL